MATSTSPLNFILYRVTIKKKSSMQTNKKNPL
uniref:Uncharacterized protein n=1 Tax=Anguilla anguilla TaxID=7936 RepID=A0A0E9WHK0_ANGAN